MAKTGVSKVAKKSYSNDKILLTGWVLTSHNGTSVMRTGGVVHGGAACEAGMGSEGSAWSTILARASHRVEPGRGGRGKIGVGEPSADAWTVGSLRAD